MNNKAQQLNIELLKFLKSKKSSLTIDADTHISDVENIPTVFKKKYESTPDYYHGKPMAVEDLLIEMKMADVDMCLVWQNPAVTVYTDNIEYNYNSLLKANRYIYEARVKYPDKIIPAGWTDPKALGKELAIKLANTLVNEFGFPVVKMNPAQNKFPIDSDDVYIVLEEIMRLRAIPAFHYGADTPYTPASGLANLAEKVDGYPILAVHMGGGGASYNEAEKQYIETRQLGLKYPHVKFVMSARRDTHTESDLIAYQLAGEPFSGNLFCASDAPYGKQTWNFGGFRWMFKSLKEGKNHTDPRLKQNPELFDDLAESRYMGGNFAEFIIQGIERLID